MERRADRGESVAAKHRREDIKTFGDMIDLHIADLREVNKPLRRTKAYALERLRLSFGKIAHNRISRELLVNYARKRRKIKSPYAG